MKEIKTKCGTMAEISEWMNHFNDERKCSIISATISPTSNPSCHFLGIIMYETLI